MKIHNLNIQVKDFRNCVDYLCLPSLRQQKSLRKIPKINRLIEHTVHYPVVYEISID